jgi:hypothetical protein
MADEFDIIRDLLKPHLKRKYQVRLMDLIHAGIIRPPLDIEADYTPEENNPSGKSFHVSAIIQRDGNVRVKDRVYGSVSMAAAMAQQPFHTKPGGLIKHEINGWVFWSFRDPQTDRLHKLDDLRQRYLLEK